MRAAALFAFALLVCCRMPDIVLKGRLWAEEGLFLQNAWTLPWHQALFAGLGGYVNLVANAGGLLARHLVSVADAPVVTTAIGLLFQLSPAAVILTSRAAWLRSPAAVAACLLLLATVPGAEEVWLNTLHSQYHLTLCVILVLAMNDDVGRPVRLFRLALILLAPLCGLGPVLILPLFVLRAVLERSGERAQQAIALGIGSAVQMLVFYSPEGAAAYGRTFVLWPGLLLYAFYLHNLVVPFAGEAHGSEVGRHLRDSLLSGQMMMTPLVISAVWAAALASASLRCWRGAPLWLFGSALILAFASYSGAIHGGTSLLQLRPNERYYFIPEVLLGWTLVALWTSHPSRIVSGGALVGVVWLIGVGVLAFPNSRSIWLASGPDFRAEVRLWSANPDHPIQLWPDEFLLRLPPQAR